MPRDTDPGFIGMVTVRYVQPIDIRMQLIAERYRLGLSRRDVARRMDVRKRVVEKFEDYFADPSLQTTFAYAAAVGIRLTLSIAGSSTKETP